MAAVPEEASSASRGSDIEDRYTIPIPSASGNTSSHASAQNPAPSVGVSPIRPGSLFVSPPVLVATTRFPHRSRHTHPTVPWLMETGSASPFSPRRCSSHRLLVQNHLSGLNSSPHARASSSTYGAMSCECTFPPSPFGLPLASWPVRRRHSLASWIGCRTFLSPITPTPRLMEPAISSVVLLTVVTITEASISIVPAEVNTLPRPQLKSSSSSSNETAWTAASRALAPLFRRSFVERR
ncbi:hypothetical protein GB937_003367 [Aspergillus fischeri]|nr:hypothetical protein GB937_003367 [Aspergillus fischeri]